MPEHFAFIARGAGGAALLAGLVAFTAPAATAAGVNHRGPARGCRCNLPASFAYTLFSPGNVDESNGASNGQAAFGGTVTLSHFAVRISHPRLNFTKAAADDQTFSTKLAALYTSPGNMAYTTSTTLNLQATTTESNHFYIWDLSPGELHGITSIDISGVPATGTVIVNVADAGPLDLAVTSVTLNAKSPAHPHFAPALAGRTIFNFPSVTALTLTGDWSGTIFAPGAATTYSNGHLRGSLDAASLTGTKEITSGPLLQTFCIPTSGPGTSPGGGDPGAQLPEGQPVEMVTASAAMLGGGVWWRQRKRRRTPPAHRRRRVGP